MQPVPDTQDTAKERQHSRRRTGNMIALVILIAILVVLAVLLVAMIVRFRTDRVQAESNGFDAASQQAVSAAESLNQTLTGAMAVADDLAEDLNTATLPYEAIEQRLNQVLIERPGMDGISVAFAPYAFDPDQRLHFVFVFRDGEEKLTVQQGEPPFDYTLPPDDEPQSQFYDNPANQGPTWTEPFFDSSTGKVLIQYGVPFYQTDPVSGEQIIAGVVAVDFKLEGMRDLVDDLDLGQTGFGAVYTSAGTWLAHPIPEFVATSTIYEGPRFQENEQLLEAAERAIEGEAISLRQQDVVTNEPVWNIFVPIASTGWVLVVELPQAEFLPDARSTMQEVTNILLVGGILLFFVLAVAFRVDRAEPNRLWAASLVFSAIALVIVIILIVLTLRTPENTGVVVAKRSTLRSYLENLNDEFIARGLIPPIEIPTGVLIQAARFPDSTSVVVNGYVWQRVPKIEGLEVAAGFALPQLIDEPMMVEEVLREERPEETLVVWSVVATLRQAFDPLEYPFDRHDIKIRLLPQELQSNAVLIPDLQSYDVTSPAFLPGLETDVRINNWRILRSFFQFNRQEYKTNFSLPGRPTIDVPELSFDISTQRRFLGPFIAFLLPALVAAGMIFAFLLNESKPDEPDEIVTALSYTAALFFVVAVMHTALRENAAAIGLTYLEYFYLLLYLMIVLVAINTFLVVRLPGNPLVRFGKNLIPKLIYWPVIVVVMLIATLLIFVYG